jgi:hypothetical protein
MAKPLRLFIVPPYSGSPTTTWTLVHGYGYDAADPSAPFRHESLFRTPGPGIVNAAVTGILSSHPPESSLGDPRSEIGPPSSDGGTPDLVDLYLHVSPQVAGRTAFDARSQQLGNLLGFAYRRLERSSLVTILGPKLDGLGLRGTLTRSDAVDLFLGGDLVVPVFAGDQIGAAGLAITAGAPAASREVGFAAIIGSGPIDCSFVYDWMRDFTEDAQADVDAFLALAPRTWPVFDPAVSKADAITATQITTFPWSVLEYLRDHYALTRDEFRSVGDNQKALYRRRLLARAGRPEPGVTEPPFEFNDVDWQNVFQLEAVAEFYGNFDDPWSAACTPRTPGQAGYTGVDFLEPAGDGATVTGSTITFPTAPDLSHVRAGRDLIVLDGDTNAARPSHTYRITSLTSTTVVVSGTPAVAGTTRWRIQLRPVIVAIDPLGRREQTGRKLAGKEATLVSSGVVHVDGTADLRRVNCQRLSPNRNPDGTPILTGDEYESGAFDTIYLPGDVSAPQPGRPARTYRIVDVDATNRRLTLSGNPDFGGGSSTWHIPAGISGEPPALNYRLGPNNPDGTRSLRGNDHHDAVFFVLQGGRVHSMFRGSSYSTRRSARGDQNLSSIRGNRRYHVYSNTAPQSEFQNYCFAVVDFAPPASPNPPGERPSAGYDGVREARFYFGVTVTPDYCPPPATPDVDATKRGKSGIRIHGANTISTWNGSHGCQVLPDMVGLRDLIVGLYLDEQTAIGAAAPALAVLHGKTHAQSAAIWNNSPHDTTKEAGFAPPDPATPVLYPSNWNNKVTCTYWLIRPDERPEG